MLVRAGSRLEERGCPPLAPSPTRPPRRLSPARPGWAVATSSSVGPSPAVRSPPGWPHRRRRWRRSMAPATWRQPLAGRRAGAVRRSAPECRRATSETTGRRSGPGPTGPVGCGSKCWPGRAGGEVAGCAAQSCRRRRTSPARSSSAACPRASGCATGSGSRARPGVAARRRWAASGHPAATTAGCASCGPATAPARAGGSTPPRAGWSASRRCARRRRTSGCSAATPSTPTGRWCRRSRCRTARRGGTS
jgi:hypothetical protein